MTLDECYQRWPDAVLQNLPPRFATVGLSLVPPGAIRDVLIEYAAAFADCFVLGRAPVLLGTAGRYKTVTAAILAQQIVAHYRVSTWWINAGVDLPRVERDRFGSHSRALLDTWAAWPFVVLDDFATVAPSSYAGGLVKELVLARFDQGLPLLVTGNVPLVREHPWGPLEVWGPSVVRRLREGGEGFTVFVT